MSNQIEELANLIKNSNRTIILTGAGISTDSGLPDFRGKDGFWTKNKPIQFQEFIDKYPKSTFIKEAEKMYVESLNFLGTFADN